jgi:hypothetical protein
MPRENAFLKGRRYLTEARLRVLRVDDDRIESVCRGDGRFYRQGWIGGKWLCECPAVSDGCCHLIALRLVTVAPDPGNTLTKYETDARIRGTFDGGGFE